jgi:predicted phage tail protein
MSSNESLPKWPMPGFNPTDFSKLGKEQADALAEMQRELSKLVEQANADWLARLELERDLASELAGKLSSARSLPDTAKAYQDWMARRMETMTKDSQKFFADSQKFMSSMNRFLMSGGKGGGT